MSVNIIQPSFAAGELAPSLRSRIDLAKWHVGAALLYNVFVHAHGGASNRPGTAFVGRIKDSAHPVRLIPFAFSTTQTYVLEFGHLSMRVIMNGGHVLEPSTAISGATRASPCVITAANHGYAAGDEVEITGIIGMTRLNGRRYRISAVTTNTLTLADLDGRPIDATGYDAYVSGGTVARVYTLVTPYAGADLESLKFTQSADVLTLTHRNYEPRDLIRTQHYAWTLNTITFQPKIATPSNLTLVGSSGSGSWWYSYIVTAETDSPVEESAASTPISAQLAQLNQDTGIQNTIGWDALPGADRFKVYKASPSKVSQPASGAMYGYIGRSAGTSFIDTNIAPDFTQTPPIGKNPFAGGNNPGVVEYYEQRRIFGGSTSGPQTLWMSQPGSYYNMDTSSPSAASDAITVTIAARQVNAIRHLVPMSSLIVLTSSGAWKVSPGAASDALTPTATVIKPQAYTGCSDVPPIVINNDVLYVQAMGASVRDLSYNFYADVFTGTDMSVMSRHLFFGYTITEWAYAEEPFKLIWAVRSDGALLSFCYLKEQDVYAWSQHHTAGKVKSIASIEEGAENAVYLVVERTIPGINAGQPVQYVERMASRNFLTDGAADVTRSWFVDCGGQYDGAPTLSVRGLDHLEGASVTILADGSVQPAQVVTNGAVTLQHAASRVIVGLAYTARIETLPIDPPDRSGGSSQGKRKKISAVTLRLENSRGLKVGPLSGTLYEIKERSRQDYGAPIGLVTDDERIVLDPGWSTDGAIAIQQDNPLPFTVLGVIPEISVGDQG